MKYLTVFHLLLCLLLFSSCAQSAKTAQEESVGIGEIDIISNLTNCQQVNLSIISDTKLKNVLHLLDYDSNPVVAIVTIKD